MILDQLQGSNNNKYASTMKNKKIHKLLTNTCITLCFFSDNWLLDTLLLFAQTLWLKQGSHCLDRWSESKRRATMELFSCFLNIVIIKDVSNSMIASNKLPGKKGTGSISKSATKVNFLFQETMPQTSFNIHRLRNVPLISLKIIATVPSKSKKIKIIKWCIEFGTIYTYSKHDIMELKWDKLIITTFYTITLHYEHNQSLGKTHNFCTLSWTWISFQESAVAQCNSASIEVEQLKNLSKEFHRYATLPCILARIKDQYKDENRVISAYSVSCGWA